MGERLTEAQLAFDLAKIDLIVEQYRAKLDNPQIDMLDVAAIKATAETFGVTEHMAYVRAKELGCLSYQAGRSLLQGEGRE